MQLSKSAQLHQDDCERKSLPKLFVWIMARLDRDLRSRVEQDARYSVLDLALPRDPAALMTLIESVMSRGDMDDEGFDNFELVRDLFSSAWVMKDTQSLTDGVRMFRDKLAHVQSKAPYFCTYNNAEGNEVTHQAFTEEFFVHLMYHNLSPKYDQAKIAYTNSVSSDAIKRITTFDGLVKHFSSVRNVTTGDNVSATTLTTDTSKKPGKGKGKGNKNKQPKSEDKGKGKGDPPKPKRVRVFDPLVHRPCTHCSGAHFDNACPSPKKQVKTSGDPSQEEIAKVMKHLQAKRADKQAKEAKALAAASQRLTTEDITCALEEYASISHE